MKMISRFQVLVLAVSGLLALQVFSMPVVSPGELSLSRRQWGESEGLVGPGVNAVAQTPDGYLWIGNMTGLFRFNGQRFTPIDMSAVFSGQNRRVKHLLCDGDGLLWFTTLQGTIAYYTGGRFTVVAESGDIGHPRQWFLHPEGGVVVYTHDSNGSRFVRVTREGYDILVEVPDVRVLRVGVSPDGGVWVTTREGGLYQLRDGQLVATAIKRGAGCFSLLRNGHFIMIARHGIYEWKEGEWSLRLEFAEGIKSRIAPLECSEDLSGRLWISAATEGLWVCELSGRLRRLQHQKGGISNAVTGTYADASGGVWVKTFSGLIQLRYTPFVHWEMPAQIGATAVLTLQSQPNGDIWFSSYGGISLLPPGDAIPRLMVERPANELSFFSVEGDRTIWCGEKGGEFVRYDRSGKQKAAIHWGEGSLTPTGLKTAADGITWLTTYKGLYRCDPDVRPLRFEPVPESEGLPNERYQTVNAAPNGDIFVVGKRSGIYHLPEGAHQWRRFSPADDPMARLLGPICLDDQQRLWGVATKSYLIGCWSGDETLHSSLEDLGLGGVTVRGITADLNGGICMITRSNGVMRIDREALLTRMRGGSELPKIQWFDKSDGLGSMGGSFASDSISVGSGGQVWCATNRGLYSLDLREWMRQREHQILPRTHIERASADQSTLALHGNKIEVQPDVGRVGIHFAAMSFGLPGEIQYRYRLHGFDDDWVELDDVPHAYFQHLPPGSYRFEVTAANRYGEWNPETAILEVTVQPHWWQKGWVRFLAVILMVLLISSLIAFRFSALRKRQTMQQAFSKQLIDSQESERKRIASDLHDSLGQNLLVVKNLALLGRNDAPECYSESYTEIAETAAEALEEVRTISRALRPPELDRLGLTKALHANVQRVSASSEIEISTELDDLKDCLSSTQQIACFRIVQECLSNVIKHANASHVEIRVTKKKKRVHFSIKDDGGGFDSKATGAPWQSEGIGLSSMRERAQLAGAQLQIHSQLGAGTRVEFEILDLKS